MRLANNQELGLGELDPKRLVVEVVGRRFRGRGKTGDSADVVGTGDTADTVEAERLCLRLPEFANPRLILLVRSPVQSCRVSLNKSK